MRTFCRSFHGITSQLTRSKIMRFTSSEVPPMPYLYTCAQGTAAHSFQQPAGSIFAAVSPKSHSWNPLMAENKLQRRNSTLSNNMICCGIIGNNPPFRCMTTVGHPEPSLGQCSSTTSPETDQPKHIKFKRLSKTAKHIMNILDKEEVEKVQVNREIPDIRPGYIIQLKVEVPENKRRVSVLKGIVIARRNAGLNTTFRLRRLVAGVGVESVFPLYSPNIKEMKVLEKKKVRRAKLYYLRDRMNALKK